MTAPSRTRSLRRATASSSPPTKDDVEALALAVPTDAIAGSVPRELTTILNGADAVFAAASSRRWPAASATVGRVSAAWAAYRARGVPPRLIAPTDTALEALGRAVAARATPRTRNAALDLAQATLDLELRHLPPARIDRARFDLWLRQVVIDAAARDRADRQR